MTIQTTTVEQDGRGSTGLGTCSFDKQDWYDGKQWGIEGAVLFCDTHGAPACPEAYDGKPSLCQPEQEWLDMHQPHEERPGYCRCGRVLEAATGVCNVR